MTKVPSVVLMLALLCTAAEAQELDRYLDVIVADLDVIDGDTIDRRSTNVRYRVYGLDAPEISRPGCQAEREAGEASKVVAERILRDARSIRIEPTGRVQPATSRFRERQEAGFVVDGVPFNDLMVAAGAARRDVRGDALWCDVLMGKARKARRSSIPS